MSYYPKSVLSAFKSYRLGTPVQFMIFYNWFNPELPGNSGLFSISYPNKHPKLQISIDFEYY